MEPAYTVKEFAELFKLATGTVSNYISKGVIRTTPLSPGRIPYSEVTRLMEGPFDAESEFYKRKWLEEQTRRVNAERKVNDMKRVLGVIENESIK